jgi:hypothetical protein
MERKKANINRSVNRDILSAHGLVVRASGKYDALTICMMNGMVTK